MIKKLLILIAVLAGLTSSAFAVDGVKFGDTPINQVPDIVKFMTGRSDFQAGKKSLMFLERVPVFNSGNTNNNYSDTSYMQARIFRFNEDGSVANTLVFNPEDDTGPMNLQPSYNLSPARPIISNQATKSGWLAMYEGSNGGNDSEAGKFPVKALPLTISNQTPSITPQIITDITKNNYVNSYGAGALSFPTYYGEIFATAHSLAKTGLKNGDPVTLTLSFIKHSSEGKIEHDKEQDLTAYTVDSEGLCHASICTGDLDNDGWKNDVALLVMTTKKVRLFVYTVTYDRETGSASLAKRYEKLIADGLYYTNFDNVNDPQYTPFTDDDPDSVRKNVIAGWGLYERASGNVFYGKFYEAGSTALSVAYVDEMRGRLVSFKWDSEKGTFTQTSLNEYYGNHNVISVQGLAADFDGDGIDEQAVAFFTISQSQLTVGYEDLFDPNSIRLTVGVYDFHLKEKIDSNSWDDNWNEPYYELVQANYEDIHPDYGDLWSGNLCDINDKMSETVNARVDAETSYVPFPDEMLSVVAGPFTGKFGKSEIVDDLAISITGKLKRVYLVTSPTDGSGNYITYIFPGSAYPGMRSGVSKIYEDSGLDSSLSGKYDSAGFFRGGLAVADFAGEGFEISHAEQLADLHDTSYIAIIPAFPYHVDNISPDGTALILPGEWPVNYSFSGFHDPTNGGGQMYVKYDTQSSSSNVSSVKFSTTATQDVLFTDDSSPLAQAGNIYFQFKRLQSNILADATSGTKYAALGSLPKKFYDFFNTNINTVSTNMNESSATYTVKREVEADDRDAVLMVDMETYIWRYKILSNYVPSWLITGDSINDVPTHVTGNDREYYISFSMASAPVITNANATANAYQPRHEEGNLFSYPAQINGTDVEGYNADGVLSDPGQFEVPDDDPQVLTLSFTNANSMTDQTTKTTTPSAASKTLNWFERACLTVKNWFTKSKDMISTTPAQTENSKSYTRTYSTSEEISLIADQRSTLESSLVHAIGYTVTFRPYVAKEGAIRVAESVHLDNTAGDRYLLFSNPNSLYNRYADPSLLLPYKFKRYGSTFIGETDIFAMKMRGVRIYSENYGGYSNSILIPGFSYRIEVPVYNASFVKPLNGVTVRLSYSNTLNPQDKNAARHVIGTQIVQLEGWTNYANSMENGTSNRGVANFEWTVPDDATTADGNYYFYVELDPGRLITEVHESRMNDDGRTIRDYGGNNEGYFPFSILRLTEENLQKMPQYLMASSFEEDNNRTIYSSSFVSSAVSNDKIAFIPNHVIVNDGEVKVKLNGSDDVSGIIDILRQRKATNPRDPVIITAEITNTTGIIFPEVLLYGVNLKSGSPLLSVDEAGNTVPAPAFYEDAFVREEFSLFPDETLRFSFRVIPGDVDFNNGWGFYLYHASPMSGGEYSNTFPEPVIDLTPISSDSGSGNPDTDSDTDKGEGIRVLPSSSGGCEAGFGGLAVIMLAGLGALIRKK